MIVNQELQGSSRRGREGLKIIIPIRCYSCGKPVAHLWSTYKERVGKGEDRKKVLDDLKLERYCCRSLFLGHVDLLSTVARFKKS